MRLIGLLGFWFLGFTLINRVMEGTFVTAADISVVNSVTMFREISVFNWTLPIPNVSYITEGLPRLVRWDYSFFGGNAAIFQYLLYSVSGVLTFLLFSLIVGLLINYFVRR